MIHGCLGDIVFSTSDDYVKGISNAQWGGSAKYATHSRHATHSLTEFVGIEPDNFSFDMYLSAYLGVNPMAELKKLWAYEREGKALPLTLGNHCYGKYRWTITSHKTKIKTFDGDGDLTSVTVSVTLQEYLRD